MAQFAKDVLPADCKLMVLDYISLPSDLKALCLTSKAWSGVATARLYSNISLDISRRSPTSTFIRCMVAGGGRNLTATRSLTLVDGDPPAEATTLRRYICDHLHDDVYPNLLCSACSRVPVVARRQLVYLIIEMIPQNCLHTFRYLSKYGIGPSWIHDLFRAQTTLKHIALTVSDNLPTCSFVSDIKTLDLRITRFEYQHGPLLRWIEDLGSLQRLSISGIDPTKLKSHWTSSSKRQQSPTGLSSLRHLSLQDIDLASIFATFSRMLDFSKLSALTLWGCSSSRTFLAEFVAAFRFKSLDLKHLAVNILDEPEATDPHVWDKLSDDFASIFKASGNIRSLHLSLMYEIGPISKLLATIIAELSPFGSSLRSLSLHASKSLWHTVDFSSSTLVSICQNFPKLQQLGIQYAPHLFYPNNILDHVGKYIIPLSTLTDLRIIHFAHSRVRQSFDFEAEVPMSEADFQNGTQRFATSYFKKLYAINPSSRLKVLVLGSFGPPIEDFDALKEAGWRLEDEEYEELGNEGFKHHVPHIFVKGERLFQDQSRTIAVPVSRRQLRDLQPELETILDWDFRSNWIGRLPGRFHD